MKEEKKIAKELEDISDERIAEKSRRFFKTGKGEYGEGDRFRGIRVPQLRKLAGKYRDAPVSAATRLLQSPFHEDRLLALFILVLKYDKGGERIKKDIYQIYMDNTDRINNWDLVDSSAEHIVGDFLKDKDKGVLHELAASDLLWERRIAIIATFHYIKRGEFQETLKIAEALLNDEEDLIHKAVGWMLRETGKRDMAAEEKFLKKHAPKMPRVMLRYAIERFPEEKRQAYLKKDKPRRTKPRSVTSEKKADRQPSCFSGQTLSFLQELALNNTREWFQDHKKDYGDLVLEPAQKFVATMGEKLKAVSPEIICDPRTNGSGSLMRIHRDLRFSKDKTPYHTHMHFIFWQGEGKKNENPAFYFGFDLSGPQAGVGLYMFPKPMLGKYRKAVIDSRQGPKLAQILRTISESGYDIKGEQYKLVPRGFDKNHERAELLRYKGLSAWKVMDWDEVFSADLPDICLEHFKAMAPLHEWLVAAAV